MFGIFRVLPPTIAVPAFYVFATIAIAFHILFGSILGVFLVSLFAYWAVGHFGLSSPLSFGELLLWLDSQPEGYKAAFISAALTVVGFVVAFHTATINWRNQLKAELKAQSAGEIEEFFAVVTRLISDASIFVQSLLDTVNTIQKGSSPQDVQFAVSWAVRESQKFIATRNQLSQSQIEVHRIKGRHYTILSSGWGLPATFDHAVDAFNKVSERMWIHVPIVNLDNPNHIQNFLNQVNVAECTQFLEVAEKYSAPISMYAGSIKGQLMSPIMGVSLPMYASLLMGRKEFKALIVSFYRNMKNG